MSAIPAKILSKNWQDDLRQAAIRPLAILA